jgi:type VI secretion system protein ImpC
MSAAYTFGERLANAFASYGWPAAIHGAGDSGKKVENLPSYIIVYADGKTEPMCPTQTAIDSGLCEKELSDGGFLPLCLTGAADAAFFGASTVHKPQRCATAKDTANGVIAARLPFILVASRMVHYLRVLAGDPRYARARPSALEADLNRWIKKYAHASPPTHAENQSRFPLKEAHIEVRPGTRGFWQIVAHLCPWLAFEELTAPIGVIAKIPEPR